MVTLIAEMTKPVDVYIPDTSALVDNPEALDRLLQPLVVFGLRHGSKSGRDDLAGRPATAPAGSDLMNRFRRA